MNKLSKDLLMGALATIPMTMVMNYLFEKLPGDKKYPLPPRNISMKVADEVGLNNKLNEKEKYLLTMLSHYSYGAAAGAMYFPFYSRLTRKLKIPKLISGMSYGFLVWAVSYRGLLPAIHLYTHADHIPKERNRLMIIAHLVWGAFLGETSTATFMNV
jgi:uncharacterized membrane protein YagU involved in acid resistance